MKNCAYCGLANPDDAGQCSTCHIPFPISEVESAARMEIRVAQEKKFWEYLSFRQLLVLIVKIQSLWLLMNAALDVTYLPLYITRLQNGPPFDSPIRSEMKLNLVLAIARVALNVAAALAIIKFADRLVSLFVKDEISTKTVGG